VRNGTRGTAEEIDRERGVLKVLTDAGERRTLPAWYVSASFVEYGYALTGHAAQGATFERAFVLARDEGALREWGYVACSRALGDAPLPPRERTRARGTRADNRGNGRHDAAR
jgi:ATP-dependent exoDNAse (exonuclease V) alpha subunit